MASATFNGTNYALQASPTVGTFPNAATAGGVVYCSSDECYASGASLDAGSLMYVGKLPAGAVVLYSIVWPIDTATYGAPDAMTNGVTGTLGISGDTDLFGDVSALNSATPQVVAPKPDGTTYTTTLDNALASEQNVYLTTATAALTATEGIAVKIFYTLGGRTG